MSEKDEISCAPLCDPSRFGHRMIALFLMCCLGFGSYYCYDNPGPLQDVLQESLNLTSFQYSNLYSWYSWPNVVLPIVGGYLIDAVFGIRIGAVLFAVFILAGQLVFATGTFLNIYWVMIIGRFIFGVGGESLAVAQNTYGALWFKGKSLNMVFGLLLSTARLGSTMNFWTVGVLHNALKPLFDEGKTSLGWTFTIAAITCVGSLFGAIALGYLDRRATRILARKTLKQDKVRLKDILTFPVTFWLLCVICVTYYVAIFPFISFGKTFLVKTFDMSPDQANTFIGLPYLISAFASPILGFAVDRFGRNVFFVLASVIFTLLSHLLLGNIVSLTPLVSIIILGLSYSTLASSLWPMCTLLIPEHQLGTAFGLIQAIQNLGLALIHMMVGIIVDNFGYFWSEMFFSLSLVISLLLTILMWYLDNKNNGNYLNLSTKKRCKEFALRKGLVERKKSTA